MNNLLTTLAIKIIEKVSGKVINKIENFYVGPKDELEELKKNFQNRFESHFTTLINWSASIPFINLNRPKDVDKSTIELSISSDITKVNEGGETVFTSELDLLSSRENILLMGQPGSGKTTTLKRIIFNYFLKESKIPYEYPILIRFRKLDPSSTILEEIAKIFGFKYRTEIRKFEKKIKKPNGDIDIQIKEKLETFIGDDLIDTFIPKFLNSTRALLILDGLDEAPEEMKHGLIQEIEELGLGLHSSKIILTVRKSEIRNLQISYSKFEISPLDKNKIQEISKKWLGEKSGIAFYEELAKKPYLDLSSRPIFLTLLMILWHKSQGQELPPQPSEVYKEATLLIAKEWDENRLIHRKSKYNGFNPRKKLKFLYEVSYYITYISKEKTFTTKLLEKIYSEIHKKYGLPISEMPEVVVEIESHNGIISEASFNTFEFSHLSIQEYLCAEYLVLLPYSTLTVKYFYEYPDPLAIAICISSDASLWFSNLILSSKFNIQNLKNQKDKEAYGNSLYKLLSRLLVESPDFSVVPELGYSVLYLLFKVYKGNNNELDKIIVQLMNYENVVDSINEALRNYTRFNEYKLDFVWLRRINASDGNYFINPPNLGSIPMKIFDSNSTFNITKPKENFQILRE